MNGNLIGFISLVSLIAVICMQYWIILSDRKLSREKEKELLNRIMARNYEAFVQGEAAVKEIPQERLTPEEYLAKYGEEGLPVI